jgi:putative transposon-encoded protein
MENKEFGEEIKLVLKYIIVALQTKVLKENVELYFDKVVKACELVGDTEEVKQEIGVVNQELLISMLVGVIYAVNQKDI